jgi:hypothetical protein
MPTRRDHREDSPPNRGSSLDINVPKLVLEFLSVLLGVLLAFAASEWQEEREKLDRAQKALVGVYHELDQNKRVLTKIHDNNRTTLAVMEAANDAGGADETDDDRSFIPGVQLQSIAWDSIQSTGIGSYIPYQTMLMLSKCYAILDVYVATGHSLTESSLTIAALATVMEKDVDNNVFQRQFGSFFAMIVEVEAQLLSCADESIKYLIAEHAVATD